MKKVILIASLCIILVSFSIYLLFPRLSMLYVFKLDMSMMKTPSRYVVPITRTISSYMGDQNIISEVSFDEFRFQIPGSLEKQEFSGDNSVFTFFGNKVMTIRKFSGDHGILTHLTGSESLLSGRLNSILNKNGITTDDELINMCLNITPDSATLFSPWGEYGRILDLLKLKELFHPLGNIIFKFKVNERRYFEFYENDKQDHVVVYQFDAFHNQIQFTFENTTQNEIDFILTSIRIYD